MAFRVQIRRGTASEWATSNPILLDGEFAIEKDTRKFKIGNGVTNWNGLLYATQGELGKSIQYIWDGTRLGIRQEGESTYKYIDLKGATGEAGTTSWLGITDKPTEFIPSKHGHDDLYYTEAEIDNKLKNKVDTITGKSLSANDYTDAEKLKNQENADDINDLYDKKVEKVTDKGLSTEDYSTAEKNKLKSIEAEANKTTIANNLTETVAGKALDATQGKILKDDLVAHKEDYTNQRAVDNLKVATVEKGLNDYKSTMANINVNQEVKQKVTGYGTISLPKNTANGQVSASVFGNTETDEEGNTKSTVSASRLKSVGKNLFDMKNSSLMAGYYDSTGNFISAINNVAIWDYIKVNPEVYYSLTIPAEYFLSRVIQYDANKNIVDVVHHDVYNKKTFSIVKNASYIRFNFSKIGTTLSEFRKTLIQLEHGAILTPYEPYTETLSYLPNVGELRSLPNGTKDEVRMSGGKAELVKRVSDKAVLDGGKIISRSYPSQMSNAWNFDIVIDIDNTVPNNTSRGNINAIFMNNGVFFQAENPEGQGQSVWNEPNRFYILNTLSNGKMRIMLSLPLSTFSALPSLQDVKNYFNEKPITLTYQLANEIVTPIQVSGSLISYPSGTIYVENVVADAGIYTTKFDIKELPIKSIDKLIKYNFTTGVQTVLDTSLALVSEDKLSFTHPNLAKDDMVFVDYFYDVEGTLGETTIEYYDSRHTIKDSVNNKFYKWDIKSANGVPSVTLTEVL